MKKDKSNKAQKPTYLVWGSIVIGLVVILVVYFVMIALGLVQVSKNHIVITTENADKMYDGEELTADGWELADGELLDGHTIEAEVLGTQTEVGESDNIITVTILDSEGADVTSTYEIEYQLGKLTVHGKKLMFYTESAQKYYDGTPLSCDKWGYYEGTLEQLMEGHEFTAHCSGQLTNIGEAENLLMVSVVDTATGEDVTKYYDVVVEKGILKVDPIRLVVSFGTTGSLGPTGGEISTDSVVVSGNLLDGHHVCIEPIETEIAGISANTIFVYVLDADGNDVTEYYEVVYPSGDLTLENPETMLPRLPDNMASTNDYKEMYDEMKDKLPEDGSGDAPTLEDYENLLKESGAADGLPPELAALALTPVYTVIAEQNGTVYLRQQSYGDFDGNDWSDPMAYSGVSPYLYSHAALSANGSSSTSVKVKPLFNNLKYVLPYYYEAEGNDIPLKNDIGVDGEFLPTVGEYYGATYIPYTYSYDSLPRTFTAEERSYAEFVYNTYLGVDEATKAELIRLAAEAGICDENGAVITEDAIAAIAEYIRNAATYNLEFAPIPDGENSVLYFLTQSKEGVCRHFAAAATLMYRSLGLPARYVTGFAANAEAGKEIIVTAMMAHAWVEVYVDGFGWLQMEVTGSDQNGDSGIQDGTGTDGLGGGGGSGGGSGGGTGGGSGSGGGAGGTGGGAGAPGDDGGDELIMSVYSTQTGPLYLREYSWGRFDGVEWLPVDDENIYHGSDPFATVVSALDGNSKAKISQLKVKMMAENMPYVLTYYANEYASTSANDCYVNGTYELEETYNVNYIYYDYITSGHITNADYTVDKDYYENYVACDGSIYLEVAQRTLDGYEVDGVRRAGLKEILESLGIEGKSLYEQIKAIKEYTQNAAYYTLFFDEVPEGEDAVLYFLNVAKKGKCWHYATAATMLYRAAGIPARFVTGYMVDIKGANAFTDVYSKNAHGWVEVYIQGVGWVQIEVTGSEPEEVTYDITIPTASATKYYGEVDVLTAETVDWTEFKKKNPTWEYEESSGKWICSGEGQEGHWFWQSDVENGFDEGLRNVGTKTNSTSFAIYDADGKSVSKQYKGYVTGRLELKPIEVTVRSESAEFNYVDGEGVWCTDFTVEKVNAGDSGYNSEVTNKDQLKQMIVIDFDYDENEPFMGDGNEQNTFTAYVAVNGERVDYYKVIYEYGTITVN